MGSKGKELWDASTEGDVSKVEQLLQEIDIDVNWVDEEAQRSSFFRACGHGHAEIVKLLLNDQRVDVFKITNTGGTPFHIACQNGCTEVVKLLLNDGRVEIAKAFRTGVTPFDVALRKGFTEIIDAIKEKSNLYIIFIDFISKKKSK